VYQAKAVLFFEGQKLISGVCLEDSGNRLHVYTAAGREMNVTINRVLHFSSYSLDLSLAKDALLIKIKSFEQKQEELKRQVDVQSLWELLTGEGEAFDTGYLATMAFGETADSDCAAAVLRALLEERTRFKLAGKRFQINTPEQIEAIVTKRRREAQRHCDVEEGSIWLESVMNGKDEFYEREDALLRLLRDYVVFGSNAAEYQLVREILDQARITDPKACFDLLVRRGVLDADENLGLERYQIPIHWPQRVTEEVERLAAAAPAWDSGERRDLTHLRIVSIDDALTRDIDDAISFEQENDCLKLGIHITDAASLIKPESSLDREAFKRATSIYLPEGKIPMLPPAISEGLLSLTAGELRPALSFLVRLTPAGDIIDSEITLSVIRVAKKMTYEEVDSEIAHSASFACLYSLTATLMERRKSAGALILSIPELQIAVDARKRIALSIRERTAPSQVVVTECMILANHLAARLFRERGVPALYRKQARPRERIDMPDGQSLYHLFRQRKLLSRVDLGIEPGPHCTLGLDLYTTITSPLRKYYDLVMQRQMKSLLAGEPAAYGKSDLKNLVSDVEPALTRAALVSQERERYWVLKYLQNKIGQSFSALVLEKRVRSYSILLCDYLLEANLSAAEGLKFAPGETITVTLEKADPFNGTLKVLFRG
jgi:exoribonuclease II